MVNVGEEEYKTVFEDYPYLKLFNSLGNGMVELITNNSFEVGQIYIFIRKGTYATEGLEDLEIVAEILPMQLKHMFGEGNPKRDMSGKDARPKFNIDGQRYDGLDIGDSFIMSCYGEDERLNHRFKYSEIGRVLSFFNADVFVGRPEGGPLAAIKQFGRGSYNSNQGDWAYIFKIPVNSLTRAFMNWISAPFV